MKGNVFTVVTVILTASIGMIGSGVYSLCPKISTFLIMIGVAGVSGLIVGLLSKIINLITKED
jgi:hypothetical protein